MSEAVEPENSVVLELTVKVPLSIHNGRKLATVLSQELEEPEPLRVKVSEAPV